MDPQLLIDVAAREVVDDRDLEALGRKMQCRRPATETVAAKNENLHSSLFVYRTRGSSLSAQAGPLKNLSAKGAVGQRTPLLASTVEQGLDGRARRLCEFGPPQGEGDIGA